MGPSPNAPLIMYSSESTALPFDPSLIRLTRPSLSSLPFVRRADDCGEGLFFCGWALDVAVDSATRIFVGTV